MLLNCQEIIFHSEKKCWELPMIHYADQVDQKIIEEVLNEYKNGILIIKF
jgi:hypothetical protein